MMAGVSGIQKVNILGVGISAVNMKIALRTIDHWINNRDPHYICVAGVHGVIESQRDENIRRVHNAAGIVTPDGMPLVWLSRLKGHAQVSRVYGPDLMLAVCEASIHKDYRHFFYGGGDGVPEKLVANLLGKYPQLNIVGMYSPPFRSLTPEEDKLIVRMINQAGPDIVWVGLSTPKQEVWMMEHIRELMVPVLIGVGAAFDFHAGLKRQAPAWMQRVGMEWFYRLLNEPRRLWRRYLFNNPIFVMLVLAQSLGLKRYSID
jgi:N-acetylglucosaminyldiphosphoundecaprenol N-acetyl-beta-D-mannosaminyltransferase